MMSTNQIDPQASLALTSKGVDTLTKVGNKGLYKAGVTELETSLLEGVLVHGSFQDYIESSPSYVGKLGTFKGRVIRVDPSLARRVLSQLVRKGYIEEK